MKYNTKLVTAFLKSYGIPEPFYEHRFHETRKWRFDLAWDLERPHDWSFSKTNTVRVALEVQGGIFIQGRHSRGAALLKEWEKLNTAAGMGWRILYCQPSDLLKKETAETIRKALQYGQNV